MSQLQAISVARREKPSLVQGAVSLPASQVATKSILAAAGQQSSEPSAMEQVIGRWLAEPCFLVH